jgi:hypothetical protein
VESDESDTRLLNLVAFHASTLGLTQDAHELRRQVALIWIDILNLCREFAMGGWNGVESVVDHVADQLCEVAGMHAVAEDIEEEGELQVQQKIGCGAGQGFLFQRALPANQLTEFLHDWATGRFSEHRPANARGSSRARVHSDGSEARSPHRRTQEGGYGTVRPGDLDGRENSKVIC